MDLSKVLLPAHSIEVVAKTGTQGDEKEITMKTMLESGYENGIFKIIVPIYNGANYTFRIGQKIDVIFKKGTHENAGVFGITCEVIQRSVENQLPLVLLKQRSAPKKIQRRQAFRIHLYNTYAFERNGQSYELITKDMSSTGMLAIAPIPLPIGESIQITFDGNLHKKEHPAYTTDRIFDISCKIIDCSPDKEIRKYYCRIQFEALSQTESKFLLQYLYNKQTEMLSANPELQSDLYRPHEAPPEPAIYNKQRLINLINVFLIFLSMAFFVFAQPAPLYGLDVFFGVYRPAVWHTWYLGASLVTSALILALSIANLFLDKEKSAIKRFSIFSAVIAALLIALSVYVIVLENIVFF